MLKTLRAAAFAALGAAAALGAHADEPYPSRTIRWIVPFLAGTSPDNTVRIVAEAMSERLGQTIIVENKPGAAGNLGAQAAARSAPDGYTWVYSSAPMATSMRVYKRPGYDVMKDFIHIGRIGVSDLTMVTSPSSGMASLGDLVARARKAPGEVMFASGGVGSPAHMGAELILQAAGVKATHIPYKGATESTKAVIGEQVAFALSITSVALPQIEGGRLKPLAVTSPQRHPRLPDVPTLQEAGVPVTLVSFGGLSVPVGTPAPIVRRVGETLDKVLADPAVRTKLEALGGAVAPSTPEEYAAALKAEIGMAEKMMAAARLEAQ